MNVWIGSHRWGRMLALGVAMAGCGGKEDGGGAIAAKAKSAALTDAPVTLDTFLDKSIEIDELVDPSGTSFPADDANLFVGDDPADGSHSAQKPTGGPSTWADWNDLGLTSTSMANHRILDCPADPSQCTSNGKDPSSFPQSNNCVGSSSVLSKMDLDYVGFSNNSKYAYAVVQRSDNSGDAGWYWLFTENAPTLGTAGTGGCQSGTQPLTYDITGSASPTEARDVLLVGHFHPSTGPLVRVFRARTSTTGTDAVSAIDFTNAALWEEVAGGVTDAAVNTTPTAAGTFGLVGVTKTSLIANGKPGCDGPNAPAQCLDTEIVTEAGVPISVFTGGAAACGVTYYGSVITRSSGSGGTSPDLKDLIGPALFRFGSTSATAALTPECTQQFHYKATGTDAQGNAIASPTCSWVFKNSAGATVGTASDCEGDFSAPAAGSYTGTVTVGTSSTDACTGTKTSDAVQVYGPISVTPSMTATCSSTFTFDSTVSGGSGSFSYAWTFGGDCQPQTTSSTSAKGGPITAGNPGPANSCTGQLVVTDARTDITTCTASNNTSATPLAPVALALAVAPTSSSCTAGTPFDDSALFTATASGGSGHYDYTWTGGCAGSNASNVTTASTCTVNPGDNTCPSASFTVTASDTNPLCTGKPSHGGSYSKSMSITASVQ